MLKGRVYMAKGDYAQAEKELREAVAVSPDDYQPYLLLGELMMAQKKLPEAIKEVDELIAKNNQFAPAYLLKAYYLDASGKRCRGRSVLSQEPGVLSRRQPGLRGGRQ